MAGKTMYISERLIEAIERFRTDIESVTENPDVDVKYLKDAEKDMEIVDNFLNRFYGAKIYKFEKLNDDNC